MSDEPEHEVEGVLRPFEPSEPDPLPPLQASSVVVPAVDTAQGAPSTEEAPLTEMVDVGSDTAGSDVWAASADADGSVLDDLGDEPVVPVVPLVPPAGVLPPAVANPEEIVLPRRPFLIGVGVAAFVILALLLLWQSGGGDGGAETAAPSTTTIAPPPEPDAPADAAPDGVPEEVVAAMTAESETRISELETQLREQAEAAAALETALAAVEPTALRGDELRRVVVAADATALSVGSEGVAVIGPFGGYASIDPATTTVTASSQIGTGATRVLRTASAVWITNYTDSELIRVDFTTNEVVARFAFPTPDGLDKLGGTLVIASQDGGFVAQVDAGPGTISRQVAVGGQPSDVVVTSDESAIWVALFDTGEVVRIDSASFEVTARLTVGAGPAGLTLVDNTLWVVNHEEGTVVAVDTTTDTVVSRFAVGAGASEAALFQGSLWVTATDAGELVQLDPTTGEVLTRTPLGSSNLGGPTGLAVGADSLWVAMQGERSVVRVTPSVG